jgi:hypothetical protein
MNLGVVLADAQRSYEVTLNPKPSTLNPKWLMVDLISAVLADAQTSASKP